QQALAGGDRREQRIERARDLARPAELLSLRDDERIAVADRKRRRERARADLRSAEVLEHGDLASRIGRGLAHAAASLAMIGGGAVGEVQPKRIGTRVDQRADRRGVIRRRPDRDENSSATHVWQRTGPASKGKGHSPRRTRRLAASRAVFQEV